MTKISRGVCPLTVVLVIVGIFSPKLVAQTNGSYEQWQKRREKESVAREQWLSAARAKSVKNRADTDANASWWKKKWKGTGSAYRKERDTLWKQLQKTDAGVRAANFHRQVVSQPHNDLLRFRCAYSYAVAYRQRLSKGLSDRSTITLAERARDVMDQSRLPWNFEQVRLRFIIETYVLPGGVDMQAKWEELCPLAKTLVQHAPKDDRHLQDQSMRVLSKSSRSSDMWAYFRISQQIYHANLKSNPIDAESVAASGYNQLWLLSRQPSQLGMRKSYARKAIEHWDRYLRIAPANDPFLRPTNFMRSGVSKWLAKQQ